MGNLPDKIKITDLEIVKEPMIKMGLSPERFMKEAGFACQIWNNPKNSYLRKATKESVYSAVMSIAQTGLTLNPVEKQAYLIPRYDNSSKSIIAYLDPGYIGLFKLLTDAGSVKSIQTNLHYEGDSFDVNLGIETEIRHKPYYANGKQKGKLLGVYAVAKLADGSTQFEHMTADEIFNIRDSSESYKAYKEGKTKSCIWVDWEGEMTKKTVLKRIAKYLPRSEKYSFAESLTNKDYELQDWQFNKIDLLLNSSSLDHDHRLRIEHDLSGMSYSEGNKMIEYLSNNQLSSIDYHGAITNKDLNAEIDRKIAIDDYYNENRKK